MVNSQVENLERGRYFCASPVDAQEHFLGQVLGLAVTADQVVHHGDEAMLVSLDQLLKGAGHVVAHGDHQADVRVAQGQLGAGLADRCHTGPPGH